MESVNSPQNVQGLRRLFDNVSSHVRSLEALGVDSATYGGLLSPVLFSKLPQDLQLMISHKVPDADWNLHALMKSVEEELTARERVGASQGKPFLHQSEYRSSHATASLVSGGSLSVHVSPDSCCYCNQTHSSDNCSTVTTVEARRQSLRKNGRCFSCLWKGHLVQDCRSSIRCHTCKGRHHSSICAGSRPCDQRQSSSGDTTIGTFVCQPHLLHLIQEGL